MLLLLLLYMRTFIWGLLVSGISQAAWTSHLEVPYVFINGPKLKPP